ncbi:MAG: MBL fold metallo-hydrolase [Candidatus Thermoplasmatota archaeon]
MEIKHIAGRGYDSNIYLVIGEKTTIVDCGTGLNHKKIEDEIKKHVGPREIQQILLTHEHFDHVGGVEKIKNLADEEVEIMAHSAACEKIEKGESIFAGLIGGEMPAVNVDVKLEDEDKIKIGDKEFQVVFTPGHTSGCICIYNPEMKVLFSGDTVFAYGSFGRTDLPGGSTKKLKESIERLEKLDVEKLYPGHENIVEEDANKHISRSLKNISRML